MCAPPKGALHRAVDPVGWQWDTDTHLTATLVDYTAAGNWQRAGDKHKRRPDPVPRPGQAGRKRARGRSLTAQAMQARQGGETHGG